MRRIFTKRFFQLSGIDQCAVVTSVIQDIQSCIGRHLNPADDRKAEKQIERIRQKAVEYGVWADRAANDTKRRWRRPAELPGQLRLWKEEAEVE
jgi:hypothetical protein